MQRPGNRTLTVLDATTRILCVLALLLVGFAHKVPSAASQTDVDLSAYALPDGTLPVICQSPAGTDGGDSSTVFSNDCEFCRLADTAVALAPGHALAPLCTSVHVATRAVHDPSVVPVHYAGAPTRGPPLT